MRVALSGFGILLLVSATAAGASIVVHDGQPGLVATAGGCALDSSGRVWNLNPWNGGWIREGMEPYDPPTPVDSLKFWEWDRYVTLSGDAWMYAGSWTNHGPCPDLPVAVESPVSEVLPTAKTLPNPARGSCQVSFTMSQGGSVSVNLFDAAGRQVRRLLEGALPAGAYGPAWDGRDDAGREVPAGVYLVKIATPAGEAGGRIVLTR